MTDDAFWKWVDQTPGPFACWPWKGALTWKGYGKSGNRNAHRVVWELMHGPASRALHVDHLCRNRACCNPKHLQLVTCAENVRRGVAGRTPECVEALLRGRAKMMKNAVRRNMLRDLWQSQPHSTYAIHNEYVTHLTGSARRRLLREVWLAQPHAICARGHSLSGGLVSRGRDRSKVCAQCNKVKCRSSRASQ